MNNNLVETWTSRFSIYPKEIEKFISYCERFQCISDVKIIFSTKREIVDGDSYVYNSIFIADVTHYSELDSLKFINVFSLFFTLSKYLIRV